MFELKDSTLVWTESDYNGLKFLEKKLSRSCAKKKILSLCSRWSGKLMKDGFKEAKNTVEEKAKEGAETELESAEVAVDDVAEGEGEVAAAGEDIEGDPDEEGGETCAEETTEQEEPVDCDTAEFAEQCEEEESELVEGGELDSMEEDQANNCTEDLDEEDKAADVADGEVDADTEHDVDGSDVEGQEEEKSANNKRSTRKASKSKRRADKPRKNSEKKPIDAVERYADKAIDDLSSSWTKSFDSEYERKLWIYQRVSALRSSFDGKHSIDVFASKRSTKDVKADVAAWNWLVAHKDWSNLDKSTREKMIKILGARDKKGANPTPSTDSQKSIYLVALKSFLDRSDSAQ